MRSVSVAPPYVIALLLLGVETPAVAQATASPVQQRLRELMMAEEQYYSDHGTCTTDLSAADRRGRDHLRSVSGDPAVSAMTQ